MWPSLVLLAVTTASGTLTMVKYDLLHIKKSVWESESKLIKTARPAHFFFCTHYCNQMLVPRVASQPRQPRSKAPEDQHCNAVLWEPASATCYLANVGFYKEDFLDTGGVEVYVLLNPDGSLPILCKECGFSADS
jgi:hypothetical protein